ncbi:MAG TPA: hypothetical protein VFI34_07540 [Candidatus Limnocylindrales bacterium]|nr:hypothetical protein [Candidatus Limnocylindrales bacterium]
MTADPLQLPETAGDDVAPRPMSIATSSWLGWVAVSIVAAMAGVYGLALLGFVGVELAVLAFAWGMAWSALTPRVLRRVGRWIHG